MDQPPVFAETFLEFNPEERVRLVLAMSGRNPEQIEAMMGRNTILGTMVGNITTCRGEHADRICACTAGRLEAELASYQPNGHSQCWTDSHTCHILTEVVKPLTNLPANLTAEFSRRAVLLAEPA